MEATTESLKHKKESDQAGNICLINFREMAEYTKKKKQIRRIFYLDFLCQNHHFLFNIRRLVDARNIAKIHKDIDAKDETSILILMCW